MVWVVLEDSLFWILCYYAHLVSAFGVRWSWITERQIPQVWDYQKALAVWGKGWFRMAWKLFGTGNTHDWSWQRV